jgi:hypothetical protein
MSSLIFGAPAFSLTIESLDTKFCTGTLDKPKSLNEFAGKTYKDGGVEMNVKAWIQGIGAGQPSPDLFTTFDKRFDGSIGGLGSKTELMYKSAREVPLFEFRGLMGGHIITETLGTFMASVDKEIQELHTKYAKAP